MSSGKILLTVFLLIFTSTGMLSLAIGNMPGSELAKAVSPFHNVVYGWHLGTWMILGMMANYFWDLCGDNKSLSGASLPALLIPILVSPIVFSLFGRLFKKNGLANIDMVWPLIAFQSGFWQVVFSKATPR